MSQIIRKFISNDAVDGTKIRLNNTQNFRARNAADTGDVDILRVNGSDIIEFLSIPQAAGTPTFGNDIANKDYVDSVASTNSSKRYSAIYASVAALPSYTATAPGELTATSDGQLMLGTSTVNDGQTILIKNESSNPQYNGLYVATSAGSVSSPFVLNRVSYLSTASQFQLGVSVFIGFGDVQKTEWLADSFVGTIDVDPIQFSTVTQLSDTSGVISANLEERKLFDSSNNLSIDYLSRSLSDNGGNTSVDYNARLLVNSGSTAILNFSGVDLEIAASIKPNLDNTHDIGDATHAIANIYVSSTIHGNAGALGLQNDASTGSIYASSDGEHFDLISYNGAVAPTLRMGDGTSGTNYVGIKAPDTMSSTYSVILPGTQGGANTFLKNDGSGNLSWASAGVSVTNNKELITLSGTDITNQYIDLAHVAQTDSIDFVVKGGGIMIEGASYDYSVNYTGGAGGNTRITFLNDLATGGPSALVAGDVVVAKYQY